MGTVDNILKYIKRSKGCSGADLARHLKISRQAVNKHLKQLVSIGKISKAGNTRAAIYSFKKSKKAFQQFKKAVQLKEIQEDKVYQDISLLLNLRKVLAANVFEIVNYAFTELLNNAIDHSKSNRGKIEMAFDSYNCSFWIRDFGIGVFHSIYQKFGLTDEIEAVQELLKGKTTTMKEKHSGEGIFFCSKSGDLMRLRSHNIELRFDNQNRDIFVEEKKRIQGTAVLFSISRKSKRKLDAVFKKYASKEFDYQFMRTQVLVRLYKKDFLSRSEAKRLLHGLDKFKEIVLDFKKVKSLGQGFADEVFRIFVKEHPNISIKTQNVRPLVQSMINHVVDNIF